tara:strand:+ start:48 stop:2879 length:2832 start_codon:yes stop_codon:yes gene_type:complete
MPSYQGYSQKREFGAYQIKAQDPADKIREQGLTTMRGMEKQIQHNAEQARLVVENLNWTIESEKEDREQNFEDKQFYAQFLANQKWKNYERSIKNHEIKRKQKEKDWQALLSLTKSGAGLVKMGMDHNKKMVDQFADSIFIDYGIGQKEFNLIRGIDDKVLNDNTKLQGLLLKWGLRGDIPQDILQRIRRGGGYMNTAVSVNEATRWLQGLNRKISQKANDPVKIPGVDTPISLNAALETNGANVAFVFDQLLREELYDKNGEKRFNNKVLTLAGGYGPDGLIARHRAKWEEQQETNDIAYSKEFKSVETLEVLQRFMGPNALPNGSVVLGRTAGVQKTVEYFAGHTKDTPASAEQFRIARQRVTLAIVDGLEQGRLFWDDFKGLDDEEVIINGQKHRWGKIFQKEWNDIVKAGQASVVARDAELQLDIDNSKLEGKKFYRDMVELVTSENPTVETLERFNKLATSKGWTDASTYLAKRIAAGKTTLNDEIGTATLLARAERNEIITPEEVYAWNLSKTVEDEVFKRLKKHNDLLPKATPKGAVQKSGTRDRLLEFIETKLIGKIERKNVWYTNTTHNDAKIGAMFRASEHYRSARELGQSHEQAYEHAKNLIDKEIDNPNGDWGIHEQDGVQSFKGFIPKTIKLIDFNREEVGKELHKNPNLLYSNAYIDPTQLKELSGQANKGMYRPILNTAMLIQSVTKGKVNAVDAMQAQLQRIIDLEIKEKGAATTQLLPKEYIVRYKKEVNKISPLGMSLLQSYNLVDNNKAYVKSGYQPPNQEPFYQKIYPLIETGDPNNVVIANQEEAVNSADSIKFTITERSNREVLSLLKTGKLERAGNALWDYDMLQEAVNETGIGLEAPFNAANQRKLLNWRFKNYGPKGFEHVDLNEDSLELFNNVQQNLNSEKIDETFFRTSATCNIDACKWLKENYPEYYGGRYGKSE